MKIHNIRLGFACNSSSTHSIIFLKGGALDDCVEDRNFGWEFWTAGSKQSKRDYLGILIVRQLAGQVGGDIARIVARELVGSDVGEDAYIDHQSYFCFPTEWSGLGIDKEFLADFVAFVDRDDVVFLGGNDNTNEDHPLKAGGRKWTSHEGLPYASEMVAKRDIGGWWSLFNRRDGNKVRLSWSPKAPTPQKSDAPELVDLKITDACGYNCSFCYQGSTPGGKHGDANYIGDVLRSLGRLRCFEVAVGGGEPTTHPNLLSIMSEARHSGVVPNITTRNVDYFGHKDHGPLLQRLAGGIAVSVDSFDDMHTLRIAVDKGWFSRDVSVQHVVGTVDQRYTDALIGGVINQHKVVLLGWKTTGRGDIHKKRDVDWMAAVKKTGLYRVGIDTALASQTDPARLKKAGVDEAFLTRKEGAFSCYIDAVSKRIGPSSYCSKSLMHQLPNPTPEAIKQAFAKMDPIA